MSLSSCVHVSVCLSGVNLFSLEHSQRLKLICFEGVSGVSEVRSKGVTRLLQGRSKGV